MVISDHHQRFFSSVALLLMRQVIRCKRLFLHQITDVFFIFEDIHNVAAVPFWAATQLKFSSFIYSFCLCLLFVTLHQQVRRGIIVRLGEMSFGIFLLHLPILKVVSPILARVGLQGFAFTQLLSIATTLAICYCVLLVTHKFLPKNLNRWLGFA